MSSVIGATQRKSDVVPVTVLMKPSMRAELERLAAEAERSLGGEVRLALREHLGRTTDHEKEEQR
jgi:TraY domain